MHYLIYKITNILNNKIYVGKHQTENINDDYFGSGALLHQAIQKYGRHFFVKEIICTLTSELEMNEMEKLIVDESFVSRADTYNAKIGGVGGFDHINSSAKQTEKRLFALREYFTDVDATAESRAKQRLSMKLFHENNPDYIHPKSFLGKKHTPETKAKMREAKVGHGIGSTNSQFGTCWITNGDTNKRIKKDELNTYLSDGWQSGRRMKLVEPAGTAPA